jgi:hypothetical protein
LSELCLDDVGVGSGRQSGARVGDVTPVFLAMRHEHCIDAVRSLSWLDGLRIRSEILIFTYHTARLTVASVA